MEFLPRGGEAGAAGAAAGRGRGKVRVREAGGVQEARQEVTGGIVPAG